VIAAIEKRLFIVWLALSALTVAALMLDSLRDGDPVKPNPALAVAAIALAMAKMRLIIREFMEVKHAPVGLCRLTDLWVFFTGAILLSIYFAGWGLSTTSL
jgi:hypothetical protein